MNRVGKQTNDARDNRHVGAGTLFSETALAKKSRKSDEKDEPCEDRSPAEKLLAKAPEKFPGGIVSVDVKEAGPRGKVLASHEADKVVKPASNTKLLTTALATLRTTW